MARSIKPGRGVCLLARRKDERVLRLHGCTLYWCWNMLFTRFPSCLLCYGGATGWRYLCLLHTCSLYQEEECCAFCFYLVPCIPYGLLLPLLKLTPVLGQLLAASALQEGLLRGYSSLFHLARGNSIPRAPRSKRTAGRRTARA